MLLDGKTIYSWAKDLFPICRSITGNGVRETFQYIKNILPELKIHEVNSGYNAFDWVVPDEWNVSDAYIVRPDGKRICEFKVNNLHLVNYSIPFQGEMSREELDKHLYSNPSRPDDIPYITSYYKRKWGFCLSENERRSLPKGNYNVVVETNIAPGSMTYADIIIPGESQEEILFSTYTCHPSMGNNEISGIVVTSAIAKWVQGLPKRRYTYRFVFVPETIGAVVYLSKHLETLKKNLKAGFIVTCVGDNRDYSYLESRHANSFADRIARLTLDQNVDSYKTYSFLKRGSDERQYCAPGINLPVCSIMRTKYAEYPEYHTSADNLELISEEGLKGAFDVYTKCIKVAEKNSFPVSTCLGEPMLSRRGLRPELKNGVALEARSWMISNILAYADGEIDLIEMSKKLNIPFEELLEVVEFLEDEKLLNQKTF